MAAVPLAFSEALNVSKSAAEFSFLWHLSQRSNDRSSYIDGDGRNNERRGFS